MVPADIGPVELSQHFVAFGKIVDMRLKHVMAEKGGKGEKEALVQFASARQAQACVSVSICFRFAIFWCCPLYGAACEASPLLHTHTLVSCGSLCCVMQDLAYHRRCCFSRAVEPSHW